MENQTNQLPTRVSLPTEVMNEVLAIFSQLPYNQVAQIITKIHQVTQPVPEAPVMSEDTPSQEPNPKPEPEPKLEVMN